DNLKNALIIKGTPTQLKAARDYVTLLEGEGGIGTGGTRIISLDKVSGATLAEALQRMLSQMRPEVKVKVILPGNELFENKLKKKETAPPINKDTIKASARTLDVSFDTPQKNLYNANQDKKDDQK